MRSAHFISPKHYSKVCDIAAEAVVQLYTNTNELYYSDIFSHIIDNTLYVMGYVTSNNHISDEDIQRFITECIDIDIDVKLSIKKEELSNELIRIGNGTFLGYSNNENITGIPFEYLHTKAITKLIYDSINQAVKVQITINGIEVKMVVETNYENHLDITDLINEYLKNNQFFCKNIKIVNINTDTIYKSGECFISNTYGPRVPYSNTKFIGLDINTNLKYAHLVAKHIADEYIVKRNLNYSLLELTYENNNVEPIQFGIKGNKGGIHIENGTFFENSMDYQRLINTHDLIIKKIKSNPTSLIEMAKWGYFNYK
jgi:hypothetical protein